MIAPASPDEWCRLIFAAAVGGAVSTIMRMIIDAMRSKRRVKITQIRKKPVLLDSKEVRASDVCQAATTTDKISSQIER